MKRFDLHVHSRASSDARGSLLELALAAKHAGLDGFAITDHDACPDLDEVHEAAQATGMVIIPGCESSTVEGHILCLGVTEAPPKGTDMQQVARMVNAQGGVCVAAHPLKVMSGIGPTELAVHHKHGDIVAAEGINGRDRRMVQDNTLNLLRRLGIPVTGGTDAHWVKDIGTAWTLFPDSVQTAEDVVALLRRGDVRADGDHLARRKVWAHRLSIPVRGIRRRMAERSAGPSSGGVPVDGDEEE